MVDWHRSWEADVALRASGLACWALAYAAIERLFAAPSAMCMPGSAPSAFAAVGFLSVSAGAALTIWGKHLFDEVAVSARWRRSNAPSDRRRYGDVSVSTVSEQ